MTKLSDFITKVGVMDLHTIMATTITKVEEEVKEIVSVIVEEAIVIETKVEEIMEPIVETVEAKVEEIVSTVKKGRK